LKCPMPIEQWYLHSLKSICQNLQNYCELMVKTFFGRKSPHFTTIYTLWNTSPPDPNDRAKESLS
jgi:hypothetical protein